MENLKHEFYNCDKVISYGTPWVFILGTRSVGKSFNIKKKRCIDRFLNNKEQFIYMRRTDEDLKLSVPAFFDDVQELYPDVKFSTHGVKSGAVFYINDKEAGYAVALSAYKKFKSVPYPDVTTMFYDEFLNEDNDYLKEEVVKALNIYQSVARGFNQVIRTNCRFIFVANHVSVNNPYFRELHIRDNLQLGTKFCVDKDRAWVVEFSDIQSISQEILNTPFGKMIAKTKYGDYALKAKFYLDDPMFIKKPEGNSRYYCTLKWEGKFYGVYEYTEESLFYITKKYDKTCKNVFSLTTKDHAPNYLMLARNQTNPLYTFLRLAYDNAWLRFDSQESKYMFMEFMSYEL